MSPHGDTRQITCHIGAPSRELRQANRRHRRIDWRLNGNRIAFLWIGFVIATLILETTR